ncbi:MULTISPECIES: hypothetical protein [Bacteroidales]|jgi:hypothetical protein|uniref:hypothetical protein n=1 Tax=Bacteroidales TaxID=171549 RepID=UPI0015563B3A|nr:MULTISPECIES: hypothetical protein [Bacteroidales]NPE37669.1 hypothetical protein [Prevotella sp. PCJ2]
MKYERTIIEGLPKKFNVMKILELLYKDGIPDNPHCVHYGLKVVADDRLKNETCAVVFRKELSSTGVFVLHSVELNSLTFAVPEYASEADVVLFASLMNAVRKKHPRTKAFDDHNIPVKYIGAREIVEMNKDRMNYLVKDLTTQEGFTMRGLTAAFTLKVEHLIPYSSVEMQAYELKRTFAEMQWQSEDEE